MTKKQKILSTSKEEFSKILKKCSLKKEIFEHFDVPCNGTFSRLINKRISDLGLSFVSNNRKYPLIDKECPVCHNFFKASKGSPREKSTCSYSCSNVYFRSGENNGMYSGENYRTICFNHHKKECVICKESNIVAVHHMDENHSNNSPENLIPLCPTHHQYFHSKYKHLIIHEINDYIENWSTVPESN